MDKTLQIVFDFSCPYCYITWNYIKRLKQELSFDDQWLGWNIHPEVDPAGADIATLVPNFDRESRSAKLNKLGAAVGVSPGGTTFIPDTRPALEALEFAASRGLAGPWCDAVFMANFEHHQDIGDKKVLLDIAGRLKLPAAELTAAWDAGEYAPVLAEHDRRFTSLQLEWVPTVFCDGRKVIEGAFGFDEAALAIRNALKKPD
ncbi:MAG: DsbA family protein [Sporomusaceae bacterium]|nr:DsbA family protein [Sporomusaceae bacterium]